MSAYVEIIFDNKDRRIATGSDEVVIRRTIGLKKDEYSIDRKSATKTDVMNLLESAGFSRSNPYYIVPQGRITGLTNAKDAERLNLLKEVAGTQVYDQRRSESIKVMNETSLKREKIDESLTVIRDRLDELEKEKEELRDYHQKDREKRSLEYTILARDLDTVNEAIDNLEADRAREIENNSLGMDELHDYSERITESESKISNFNNQIELIRVKKSQAGKELRNKLKLKAQKELEFEELMQTSEQVELQTHELGEQIKSTRDSIRKRRKELDQVLPEWERLVEQEKELRQEVAKLEAQKTFLYRKQGRNQRFSSKRERDSWLRKEIKSVDTTIEQRKGMVENIQTDLQDLEQDLQKTASAIAATREEISKSSDRSKELWDQKAVTQEKYDRLDDERKTLWRKAAVAESELSKLNESVNVAQRNAFNALTRAQSSGLKAVRRLTERLGLSGVYGPLAELISVEPKFKLATEVTAGNSLFHVVVDTDETASQLMSELFREKSGRVTFMPLNRLSPKNVTYPDHDSVTPLIDMIEYDPTIESAVRQVFGTTVVAMNLDIGSQIAHSNELNAITINGDRVNTKGVLTGGFYDIRRSKLSAFQELRDLHTQVAAKDREYTRIQDEIDRKGQEINETHNELSRITVEYQTFHRTLESMNSALQPRVKQEADLKTLILEKRKALSEANQSIQLLEDQSQNFQNELRSDFEQTLTTEEISLLENVRDSLPRQKELLQDLSKNKSEIEQTKNDLEVEIEQNLEVRLDQLMTQYTASVSSNSGGRTSGIAASNIAEAERQLQRLQSEIETTETELATMDTSFEDLSVQKAEEEKVLQQTRDVRIKLARRIENIQKVMEKNTSKRGVLASRRDETQRKIRELGVLPPDAFSAYESMGDTAIHRRFRELSDDLKQFSHVNKKAVEQYNSFTQQEQKLLDRKKELENSHESIEQLIQTLDMRKDEAIDRTFRQVSKSFSEIFEKLVPAGKGELIMHRKHSRDADQRQANDDEDSDGDVEMNGNGSSNIISVENYTGVGISVSFNSKEDDQQRIEQLSGGQKSLCALTLIFAIQQSDPAPFYLFDEIDANLDTQYRTAVASMIQELSRNAQFICTTFRTEMLRVARKFYGVSFENKMSSIASITEDNALQFIQGQQKD